MLLRLAERVDGFSVTCGECQAFQQDITQLVQDLGNLTQLTDKARRQSHFDKINEIIKHLQKSHKMVTQGQYFGIAMTIGTAIGTALGAAFDNIAIGAAIGTALGLLVGGYLDRKAKEEGRVI